MTTIYEVHLKAYVPQESIDQLPAESAEDAVQKVMKHHNARLAEVVSVHVIATDVEVN